MRPPPDLSVHEWAEAQRKVPVGTSPEPGRWISRPYQREPLEAISDPACEAVLYLAASQGGGKTEILLCAAGYYAAHDPSPMLVIEPSLEMAEALSKDRIAPMVRETPVLRDLLRDPRSRDSGNTVRHKEFPGGHMTFVGANSAAGLAMRPIRVCLFDEIDRYPPSAGTEGDPIKLAETRASAFWNRVFVYVTSPGRKEGRSHKLWMQSDMSEFYVPCPECDHAQVMRWAQVSWQKNEHGEADPESAVYACEKCGSAWDDATRWGAIYKGGYRSTGAKGRVRGFRLPAMAVLGFELAALVREWTASQGNPELLKVFINTRLCEWWEEQYETVDETGLSARRESLPEVGGRAAVPAPAALLTAGVDVQDNRLEVSVFAWGAGEESWLLEHHVLHAGDGFADPSNLSTWEDLDAWLLRPYPREAGGVDFIRGVCVDTGGHHTQTAYDFCGPRFRRVTPDGGRVFVFAVKGQSGAGEVWPRKPSKVTSKVPLWPIRVDPAKEQLYGRLQIADPGPGYIHLPKSVDEAYLRGLTAEKVVTTVNRKGFPQRTWKLRRAGLRNEPLDCGVYAYAALCGLRANGFDLEREVEGLVRRPVFKPEATSAPPKPGRATRERESRRSRSWPDARERDWIEPRRDWWGGR